MERLNIFLSWSGERSRLVAKALQEWLPSVLQFAEPWMSEDTDRGANWLHEVYDRLDSADVGVICLASDNLANPWLLFEAGVLLKTTRCTIPYLHGVQKTDVRYPLASFQASDSTREDTLKLVRRINAVYPAGPLSEKRCDDAFEHWWPRLEALLTRIDAEAKGYTPNEIRTERELLEETLELTRALHRASFSGQDASKTETAVWIAQHGNLDLSLTLAEEIQGADHLVRIADAMIRGGFADAPDLRRLLDKIQARNNAELRRLALMVVDRGDADADVLRYMVRIMSNMAELRKVAIRLAERGEHNRPIFGEIAERLQSTNRTMLREVALELVRQRAHRGAEFERIMDRMVQEREELVLPSLEEIKATDPEMLPLLYERYKHLGSGNAVVAWLRRELGLD